MKAAVKDGAGKWKVRQQQKKREKVLEALRPIFDADVDGPDFSLLKLIRIAHIDQKHTESEVCRDSIGFVFSNKGLGA